MGGKSRYASDRQRLLSAGLKQLDEVGLQDVPGKNGESLSTDEAAVWKRVLNLRISRALAPCSILETHPGAQVSTAIYSYAAPDAKIYSHLDCPPSKVDLVDIDPFGAPWATLERYSEVARRARCVMISNGEAQAVVRNLRRAQRYPTSNFGRLMPRWVEDEFVPRLEQTLSMQCRFFYAFPTTVRCVFSVEPLPEELWQGCPNWMWWLRTYA